MKKKLPAMFICMITAVFISVTAGCMKTSEESKTKESNFDIKIAENLVNNYMYSLMNSSSIDTDRFYTYEMKEMQKQSPYISSNLRINGYTIDEINETGKSGTIKMKVIRSDSYSPYAELAVSTLKVIKEGSNYKISDIDDEIEKSALKKGTMLRYKTKNNVKTNLLLKKISIPPYAFSKDDKAMINKLPVPVTNYGILCFSYKGDEIVITTHDKDAFAAVVKIDESKAVQGNGEEKNDAGGSDGQGGSEGIEEEPVGKEMIPLDLLKDSSIERISFSLDEKYILIQYAKKNAGSCLRLYRADSGQILQYRFEDNFPIGKVKVVFSSFDKDVLNFEVIAASNKESSINDLIGKWQLDLKEFKAEKI